ncbi:MAG: ribonuclease III domain-containing protein [Acutalibacteraceae bacterium]|nr:ribonuclease III domain-containing protein [Acutalibacteraceae bacterium]
MENIEFNSKTVTNDALSFVGDAVYSLLVRERLIMSGECRSGSLHSNSTRYVSARAQAKAYERIKHILTEAEAAVYKRGRNAHNNNTPKNTTVGEYHSATGIEALFGYLYLNKEQDRITYLFDLIWND